MKVIYINTLSSYRKGDVYKPGSDAFYLFGLGQFFGREFMNRNFQVSVENWRVDARIDIIMEKNIDGIYCRIFPSKTFFKPFGEFSFDLLKALLKEAKCPDTVFHFIPTHLFSYHLYASFLGRLRAIATHCGNPNPLWRYEQKKRLKYLFFYYAEKYLFLRNYKSIFTISRAEVEYYNKTNTPVQHMATHGIAREYQFIIKERDECRKLLDIPLDKKIILQVGRAVEYRGFDWMLNVIDYYSDKDDYLLIFLGINKWDPYYHELIKRKCLVKEHMNHTDLVDYYNAADVLIFFYVGDKVLTFGGPGFVPIESLACGTPVVATSLHHIDDTRVTEVARIPKKEEDVIPMIEELLSANISREKCREIALELFSWDTIIDKYWEKYTTI